MSDNQVIFQSSKHAGAPTLSASAGSLLALLDACLVTGYGLTILDTVTVSNGVATASKGGGHGFQNIGQSGATLGPVVQIEGATPAGLNGNWRITITGASSFTFACPGVPNGTATGTITAKIPPLGWEKSFTNGSTVSCYRNIAGTGMYLRFQDDATVDTGRTAFVRGYESMVSVDVGSGPFPPLEVVPTIGRYVHKYTSRNEWMLIGDAKRFYFLNAYTDISRGYWGSFFGDILPVTPGDAYHFILAADSDMATSADGYGTPFHSRVSSPGLANYALWAPRSFDQIPGPITYMARAPTLQADNGYAGQNSGFWLVSNPADGAVLFEGPVFCLRTGEDVRHYRGFFPGCLWFPFNLTAAIKDYADNRLFDGIIGMPNVVAMIFSLMSSYGSVTSADGCLDVRGPWET